MSRASVQRLLGLLAVVALAVVAVFAITLASPTASAPPDAALSPSSSTRTPPGGATTPPPTATATSPPPRATTTPPGAGATATTGPGLTEVGIHVVAQPDANGAVEVLERLRLLTPVGKIQLSPPSVAGVPGLTSTQPAVVRLQGLADGAPIIVARSPARDASQSLPRPSTVISLRYRLEGVAARIEPSPVGRVLIALPPIAAAGLGKIPVVVEVVGPGVRNLVCPELPPDAQLCGREHDAVWSTTAIPADRSLVIAQFDLPRPKST